MADYERKELDLTRIYVVVVPAEKQRRKNAVNGRTRKKCFTCYQCGYLQWQVRAKKHAPSLETVRKIAALL